MTTFFKTILVILCLSVVTTESSFAQDLNTNRKLTKSEKQELRDSLRARARQTALEKEVDRRYRKNEKEKRKTKPITENDVVYLFGVGTNFNDSTIYLTDIIPVNYLRVEKKTGFLPNRVDFSLQFREYLEGKLGLVNETTCVFYNAKKKKITNHYYKLRRRYLEEGYRDMTVVDPEQFSFKLPPYVLESLQKQ